ncbi:Sorting nexin MVP1 [Nakaseomyces glabratus]|nr:Sorting nexin MVP1 [Nakaseomyces glabratus]KTB19916.1 Sorting nexin MVP1 [Nakaseomyces glabratus]
MDTYSGQNGWADTSNASPWGDTNDTMPIDNSLSNSLSGLQLNEDINTVRANLTESIWGTERTGATNNVETGLEAKDSLNVSTNFNELNTAILSPTSSTSNIEEQNSFTESLESWIKEVRKTYNPQQLDIISIEEIPEREGLLFKHANYSVKHLIDLPNTEPPKNRTVVRRYSDFLWLQEVLLKRYPFRMIPDLPPKKIGSQNLDPVFLNKRRIGLSKFINLVMKHPKLSKDDLVLTFLTVPTDLTSWRKQVSYDTADEFTDKRISKDFVKIWKKDLAEIWNNTANCIDELIDKWTKISILVDRHEKRLQIIANERKIMNDLIHDVGNLTKSVYPIDQNPTILDINSGMTVISKHIEKTNENYNQQALDTKQKVLPKFRMYTDILRALKNVFERYKMLATNNVSMLQKHIDLNLQKLEDMKGKPDASGQEYDRIKTTIRKDRKIMYEQSNRAWLIRECILEEFTIFQETQFMITGCFQEWAKVQSTYSSLNLNEWENVTNHILEMPLSRE